MASSISSALTDMMKRISNFSGESNWNDNLNKTSKLHEAEKKRRNRSSLRDLDNLVWEIRRTARQLPLVLPSSDAYTDGLIDCETCCMSVEGYKQMMKASKPIGWLVNDVIEREQISMMDELTGETSRDETKYHSEIKTKTTTEYSTSHNRLDHSVKCLLIELQKALVDLMTQVCYVKVNHPGGEEQNIFDIPIRDLKKLKLIHTNLTEDIICLFKRSMGRKRSSSTICVRCFKDKLSTRVRMMQEVLKSGRKLKLTVRRPRDDQDPCCSRTYPHRHCVIEGRNTVIKYSLPLQTGFVPSEETIHGSQAYEASDLQSNVDIQPEESNSDEDENRSEILSSSSQNKINKRSSDDLTENNYLEKDDMTSETPKKDGFSNDSSKLDDPSPPLNASEEKDLFKMETVPKDLDNLPGKTFEDVKYGNVPNVDNLSDTKVADGKDENVPNIDDLADPTFADAKDGNVPNLDHLLDSASANAKDENVLNLVNLSGTAFSDPKNGNIPNLNNLADMKIADAKDGNVPNIDHLLDLAFADSKDGNTPDLDNLADTKITDAMNENVSNLDNVPGPVFADAIDGTNPNLNELPENLPEDKDFNLSNQPVTQSVPESENPSILIDSGNTTKPIDIVTVMRIVDNSEPNLPDISVSSQIPPGKNNPQSEFINPNGITNFKLDEHSESKTPFGTNLEEKTTFLAKAEPGSPYKKRVSFSSNLCDYRYIDRDHDEHSVSSDSNELVSDSIPESGITKATELIINGDKKSVQQIKHHDKDVEKILRSLGMESLERVSIPSDCSRSKAPESSATDLPLSPSLSSLPLDMSDLDYIARQAGKSLPFMMRPDVEDFDVVEYELVNTHEAGGNESKDTTLNRSQAANEQKFGQENNENRLLPLMSENIGEIGADGGTEKLSRSSFTEKELNIMMSAIHLTK